MKGLIHWCARMFETIVDRLRRERIVEAPVVDPYIGHSTSDQLVLKGRVLAQSVVREPTEGQGTLRNLGQMLRLFWTKELEGVELTAEGQSTQSDEEGYFTLELPRLGREGRFDITVALGEERVSLPVLATAKSACFGVISDIDDTLLVTGAYAPVRMVWTTMTGNVLTRQIYSDAKPLLDALLEQSGGPVFYVSSSPWNLHPFLIRLFERASLPLGPLFLRDFGIDRKKLGSESHGEHKGDSIHQIFDANPDLPFVLIGDIGQYDAQVYRQMVLDHPGRVAAVVLRAPGPGEDDADREDIAALRETGVPVFVAPEFDSILAPLCDILPSQ